MPIVMVGAIRGVAVSWLLNLSGTGADEAIYTRIPVSIIAILLWLGLLAYLVNQSKAYNQRFEHLFSRAVLESLRSPEFSPDVELGKIPEILEFKNQLNGIIDFSKIEETEAERIFLAASAIKSHIQLVLRPLSHRLWISADFTVPKIRYLRLILDSVQDLHFSAKRILLPWIILFFFGALPFLPPERSFELAVIFILVISLPLLAAQIFTSAGVTGPVVLGFISVIYLFTPVPFTNLILNLLNTNYTLKNLTLIHILTALTGVFFIVANSAIKIVGADRSKVLDSIPQALEYIQGRKHIATYLHNSVQSQLTAISMQLDAIQGGEISEDVKSALSRLGTLVNLEIPGNAPVTFESLEERLTSLTESWRGVATLSFTGFSNSAIDGNEYPSLIFFIEEVITNSVRHGGASEITFALTIADQLFRLEVDHNGGNPIIEGTGVGVAWLNEYAKDRWEITTRDGRTTLIAEIKRVI